MRGDPTGAPGELSPATGLLGTVDGILAPWLEVSLDGHDVLDAFRSAAGAWDDEVAGRLFAAVVVGGDRANAGRFDGVNQMGWASMSTPGAIALTRTWFTPDGVAVEGDATYNTKYRWSLDGAADAMDVQFVATHEPGHTLGLGHPASTRGNSCLTMYAAGDFGETKKRTLGSGDIRGIVAIYG